MNKRFPSRRLVSEMRESPPSSDFTGFASRPILPSAPSSSSASLLTPLVLVVVLSRLPLDTAARL